MPSRRWHPSPSAERSPLVMACPRPSRPSSAPQVLFDGCGEFLEAGLVFEARDLQPIRLLTHREAAEEDRTFWHGKTPWERLAAAEQLRQIAFGYDASTSRIQAIAECLPNKRASGRNKDLADLDYLP